MKELPKAYEPQKYEDTIYTRWEESGFFNPDNLDGKEPYAIMMPPPNVTGVLHLGHALENTLMDTMARFQRMQGKNVLLLPGTDHAAVATQARVEKNLIAEGMEHPRDELGRDGLLEKIREYAEGSKATILNQIKKMGTSADWSRLAYTFDEERSEAVNAVFKAMYEDGLIYRGHRVVNWSVKGQSTCSDDELEYVDREGKLYTFKYSKDTPITIATTRPETKLGDTAIAVHPEGRWKQYIGQEFTIEHFGQDEHALTLKVIADENVDDGYGTGALGVTTAHSPIDFEMYMKQKALGNDIGMIQVIGEDGKMTTEAGSEYEGLTVKEAREKVVKWLRDNDLLENEEDVVQSVGTSDRFGDVVEAIPKTQWWLDVNKEIPGRGKSLRELMKDALTTGLDGDDEKKVTITPERFTKLYLDRVNNLRDWCLSRQIWWGHRIPVWYRVKADSASRQSDHVTSQGEEIYVGVEAPEGDGWVQDEDTLDTWFSSGMWTFSTLGWPSDSEDFKTFHPTNWMQMGYEILYLWLMRMVLFSAYNFNDIPFKDAYIHGMLRDKNGNKFSKSAGNGIDPIEVINEYGTDALRYSLIAGISPGNDSKFYTEKVEGAKHLVNKLWNLTRFMLMSVTNDQGSMIRDVERPQPKTLADAWILIQLDQIVQDVTLNIEQFKFSQAAEDLRDFTWSQLADWYLEIAKREEGKTKILNYILNTVLKLWHPYLPFVTEAIWQEVYGEDAMLMVEKWPSHVIPSEVEESREQSRDLSTPQSSARDDVVNNFELLQEVITAIRSLRAEKNIEPGKEVTVVLVCDKEQALLDENAHVIRGLARVGSLTITNDDSAKPEQASTAVVGAVTIHLDLAGAVDVDAEKARLQKEIDHVAPYVLQLKKKLSNKGFVDNAPEEVLKGEKKKLEEAKQKLEALQEQITQLTR